MNNLEINIKIEQQGNSKQNIEIVHVGIVNWREQETDAFWIKLFLKSSDNGIWPKIRISSTYKLFEVRDFSHMFFAWDNQMSTGQLPDYTDFNLDQKIVYKVYEPEEGQEKNQYCKAISRPLKITPSRVKIERALDNVFYVEPHEFLSNNNISNDQIGVWLFCRSEKYIKDPPNTISFSFKSNIPIRFIKYQFILPAKSFVEEEECKVSKGIFKTLTSSNQLIGQPGWIPLLDPITSEFKLISSYYNLTKPIYSGEGTLVYSEKDIKIKKITVFNQKIVLSLFDGSALNLSLKVDLYILLLILIAHYRESIIKPINETLLVRLFNKIFKLQFNNRSNYNYDDILLVINSLRSLISTEISNFFIIKNLDDIIKGGGHKYHVFSLLRKYIRSSEVIDIDPIEADYNKVSKILHAI